MADIDNAFDLGTISEDKIFNDLNLGSAGVQSNTFKFELEEACYLALKCTDANGTMPGYIQLFDENNNPVQLSMSGDGILEAGVYYLTAVVGGNSTGTLSFDTEEVLASNNNTLETAYDLGTISSEMSFSGVYLKGYDKGYYKFTLDEGSLLSFSTTYGGTSATGSPSPTFYKEDGTQIMLGGAMPGAATVAEFEAGTYYVALSGSGMASMTFEQSKVITGNNSFEKAYDLETVSGKQTFDGIFLSMGETEYYKFTLTEDSIVGISTVADSATGMPSSPTITLYNSNDSSTSVGQYGGPTGGAELELAKGTYVIQLPANTTGSTAYSLEISQSKVLATGNNSFEKAYDLETVSGKQTFDGIYLSMDETEYYKFTLTEDSIVDIFASPAGGSSDSGPIDAPRTILYDVNGIEIANPGVNSSSMVELVKGTYIVELRSHSSADTYTLEIGQSKALVVGNDDITRPCDLGVISGKKSFSGLLLSATQEYFKFTLNKDSVLDISVPSSDDYGYGGMSPTIQLYDADGEDMGNIGGGAASSSATELTAGTYIIGISSHSMYASATSLVFKQQDLLCTGNDDKTKPYDLGVISGEKSFSGLYLSMTEEFYTITLNEDSVLDISAIISNNSSMPGMSSSANITVYDFNNPEDMVASFGGGGAGMGPTARELAKGKYIIGIQNAVDSAATLDFEQKKVLCVGNDSFENAYDLKVINGEISFDGIYLSYMETECFKFELTEASTLSVSATVDSSSSDSDYPGGSYYPPSTMDSTTISLYNKDEEWICDFGGYSDSTQPATLEKGTYYIRFSSSSYGGDTTIKFNQVTRDVLPPNVPVNITASETAAGTKLDWADSADNGKAGLDGYYIRYGNTSDLTGEGEFVEASEITFSDLEFGTYYCQIQAVDRAGNTSDWSEVKSFKYLPGKIQNLKCDVNGLTWDAVAGVSGYVVEISNNNFVTVSSFTTAKNGIDTYELPQGNFQWRVKAVEGEDFTTGAWIYSAGNPAAQKLESDGDGNSDVFFGNASGKWAAYYKAEYQGIDGIEAEVSIAGKNKITDVFYGSETDNATLVLTDDSCGDALFIDDIYNAFGDKARISQINEIRAGAGDDIIDLSSSQFDADTPTKIYAGDGNDTIWGSAQSNLIFGDAGDDNIIGGVGSDLIIGGAGDDTMHGGGDVDIFCFGGNWGKDTVTQLDEGGVFLWFESGSSDNWDEETLTYTDGENSVTVQGTGNVLVIFGDAMGEEQFAIYKQNGCFSEAASGKSFDDKNKGTLA